MRTAVGRESAQVGRLPAWIVAVALGIGALVSVAGAPSADAHTAGAGTFTSISPARLLDTRNGTGAPRRPIQPGASVEVAVTGHGGVPTSNVSAAVLNVTVTRTSAAGHITAYPLGATAPTASNLNFTAGQTIANAVTVKVGTNGKVLLSNGSSRPVDLIADVSGWYGGGAATAAGTYTPLDAPTRVLDTRTGTGVVGGVVAPVAAGESISFKPGTPSEAASAVLNVTVTRTTAAGHITAFPTGASTPTASNLNFTARQTIANAVTVKRGAGGEITLHNGSSEPVDLIVDTAGWFRSGAAAQAGAFTAVDPTRLLDTRNGTGRPNGSTAPVPAKGTVTFKATNAAPTIGAVALNVTSVRSTQPGHVTAHPGNTSAPLASNLNFVAGQTIPNQVTVKVAPNGDVTLTNGSTAPVHLIADLSGTYRTSSVPSTTYRITYGDTVVVTVFGTGFSPTTQAGDAGVYAGIARAGTIPDTSDRDNPLFINSNWVMPQNFTDGRFTITVVLDPDLLRRTTTYSVFTWQAHTHSNTTQDTQTQLAIDWSKVP